MDQLAESLNPFGTGQCLTTDRLTSTASQLMSQSLWNRAVSYDIELLRTLTNNASLNPFGTGQCLTTAVGSSRLTEATSQLFPRLRELGLDLAKF